MTTAKSRINDPLSQLLNKVLCTFFEEQFRLHPHLESRLYLLCTSKNITSSSCFTAIGRYIRYTCYKACKH